MNKKGVSAKNYIITDIALKILSSSYLKKVTSSRARYASCFVYK